MAYGGGGSDYEEYYDEAFSLGTFNDSDTEDYTHHYFGRVGLQAALAAAAAIGGQMTEEGPNPYLQESGGYDIYFISEVSDSLICLICSLPSRDPHQVDCCGKIFCNSCLLKFKMKSDNQSCPNCRSRMWRDFPDKKSDRDIQALTVKCSNREAGCSWEGDLREMGKHLIQCSSELNPCKYASIGCKVKTVKSKLKAHEDSCTTEHLKMALIKIESLTEDLKTLEFKVAKIRVEPVKTPPIVYQLTNFAAGIAESPPVYSHPRGYKLYLQVCWTKLGITVNVCLMHGEYDDRLIWPFRGTVTFRLMNQDANENHRLGKAKFLQQKLSEKNQRVSAAQGKSTSGWGVTNIVKYAEADFPCFTRNEAVYVEITSIEVAPENKPWLI